MNFKAEKYKTLFVVKFEPKFGHADHFELETFLEHGLEDEKSELQQSSAVVFDFESLANIDFNLTKVLIKIVQAINSKEKKSFAVKADRYTTKFLTEQGVHLDFHASLSSVLETIGPVKKTSKPKINTEFINPFLTGTIKVLGVQCSVEAKPGKPVLRSENEGLNYDIAGVIGLTSNVFKGSIAICFPEATFLKIMSNMLGEDYTEINEELEDGAGELLNMIFGQVKIELNEKNYKIEKAIPTVVRGKELKVKHLTQTPAIILPFESTAGNFHVEIGLN